MIIKRISYGTIDIDPDEGKIWINCPNCMLRIQNLRFNKISEKFLMIDVNGNDVWMLEGSFPEDPVSKFIEILVPVILKKNEGKSYDEIQEFLDNLLSKIREDK